MRIWKSTTYQGSDTAMAPFLLKTLTSALGHVQLRGASPLTPEVRPIRKTRKSLTF